MESKNDVLLVAISKPELAKWFESCPVGEGCKVAIVHSLTDVFVALQHKNVQVLVMDAGLAAGMNFEAISIIKGLHRKLPIIVTTEENNPELESTIRKKGIFYYHVEMFGMEELMLAISNAMARSLV